MHLLKKVPATDRPLRIQLNLSRDDHFLSSLLSNRKKNKEILGFPVESVSKVYHHSQGSVECVPEQKNEYSLHSLFLCRSTETLKHNNGHLRAIWTTLQQGMNWIISLVRLRKT